jgi:SAM-dependent methyltransferase
MRSHSRQQLENWLSAIEVKGRVLDVGGSQNPVKGRTRTWEAEEYEILDLDQSHECKRRPDILADIQSAGDVLEKNYFDVTFCIEVSEYWTDPMSALRNINYALRPGGILYISFHFVYPHHEPKGEDCLRYTRWGVEKVLKETGFKIEEITPRYFRHTPVELFHLEGMRGLAGNFDPIHEEQGWLVKAMKIVRSLYK